MKKGIIKFSLILLIVFSIGFFLGSKKFPSGYTNIPDNTNEGTDCENTYRFLNPFIACDLSEEKNLEMIKTLENKINKLIDASIKNKTATRISVFFRDLTSKKWVGINENENYIPASLLKLPILIAYFKLSEIQTDLFSQKYILQEKDFSDVSQNIESEVRLEQNKEYTIEELLDHMIIYSDNDATKVLLQLINTDFLSKVYEDLGVTSYTNGTEQDFLSPKTYASILRMLYNSSYLTRQNSEKILELMNEATFKDGLVAGIATGIPVAHKFGERKIIDQNTKLATSELHDCGIIYYPQHPYILCVMTTGNNFNDLKEIIKNISNFTYEEISKK